MPMVPLLSVKDPTQKFIIKVLKINAFGERHYHRFTLKW